MKKFLLIIMCFILILTASSNRVKADDHLYANLNIQIASGNGSEYVLKSNAGFVVKDQYNSILEIPEHIIKLSFHEGLIIQTDSQTYGPYNDVVIYSALEDEDICYNGKHYDGGFYVIQNGSVHLINRVPIEDYIYSVVAGEVGSTFEPEAIKAQAIAARSYAVTSMKKYVDEGYDLKSSVSSQIYSGKDKLDQKIIDAVDATRGEFLFYKNEIVHATYSSSNGGVMASAEEAWGKPVEYLISKEDPYSTDTPKVNWMYSITLSDLEQKLLSVLEGSTLVSIDLQSNPFGRVQTIVLNTNQGPKEITANALRNLLGGLNIKSTYFHLQKQTEILTEDTHVQKQEPKTFFTEKGNITVDLLAYEPDKQDITIQHSEGSDLTFVGKGFGHGVGMSQYGANEMAKQGKDYKEILLFYYNGVEIKKLYD